MILHSQIEFSFLQHWAQFTVVNCAFKRCMVDTWITSNPAATVWAPDPSDHRWQEYISALLHYRDLNNPTVWVQYLSPRSLLWLVEVHHLLSFSQSAMMTEWSSSSSVTLIRCLGLCLLLVGQCQADCREAGLCCSGRDPSCTSEGWRSDRSYGTCYCDQACISTLDCCHDYETACPGRCVWQRLSWLHQLNFWILNSTANQTIISFTIKDEFWCWNRTENTGNSKS